MKRLTNLQEETLRAFFRISNEFFLTGGAALAGIYLGHRETKDLDLFTTSASLEGGVSALRQVVDDLGGSLEVLLTSPDFRRFLFTRGDDAVVIDLVRDRGPQIAPQKLLYEGILVDPPHEILANKLCALLSRGEVRDLVDVLALEGSGLRIEDAIGPASMKDGGLTPAQLAWVLSQIQVGEDARVPGGVTAVELRGFLENLIHRLTRLAHPH